MHILKSEVYLILLFAVMCRACADDETAMPNSPSTDELTILQQEYKEAQAAYGKATQVLALPFEEDSKWQKSTERFHKQRNDLFGSAVRLAQDNPNSRSGFAALEWLLETPDAYYSPAGPQALDLMSHQYAANPKIGKGIAILAYYFPWTNDPSYYPALDLLKAVVDQNPNRTARGQAALGLAYLAKREFRLAESNVDPNADSLAIKAETVFDGVLRNYGDCPNLRRNHFTLGDEAEEALFELRHLGLGQQAPEIDGDDLNGVPLKLSGYRGKVVLLEFWASWCSSCIADIPQEKALIERFKGRPFVIVGVNGDRSKVAAQKAVAEHKIVWRSFWDGDKGPNGPIALTWDVQGWPTYYVLDQKGVIRLKGALSLQQTALQKLVDVVGNQ